MNKRIEDNVSLLNNITWHDVDKKGHINKSLKSQPAIYIYMNIPLSLKKPFYYVGSTIKLAKRLSSHRYNIINWEKCKKRGCPIFYESVRKQGWSNFKFAVLEYVNLSDDLDTKQKRKILLIKEQYYLDSINPSLNTCKMADSPLGIKRSVAFSKNLSKSRRGFKHKSFVGLDTLSKVNAMPKVITNETRLLISSRCQGIKVKIFDKSNNFIKEFPTMTSAALYQGVHRKTISMIYKRGKSFDDYIYEFEVKDTRVWVYDSNNKLLKILDNIKKTSIWGNLSEYSVSYYLKLGKLYRNEFYFKKSYIESNILSN